MTKIKKTHKVNLKKFFFNVKKKDQASLESQFTEKLKVSQPGGGASAPAPKIVETPIKPPQAQTLGATAAAAPTQSTLTSDLISNFFLILQLCWLE